MIRGIALILICLNILFVALPCVCPAAEKAIAVVETPAEKQYWVGQRIDFAVELLVIGQFTGTPQFDLPELPGVLLMKADSRPTLSSRDMNGRSYVAQRHDFALYAQHDGVCKIPSFDVRFDSKERFDTPVIHNRLSTKAMQVTVNLPEGARPGAAVVSTTELSGKELWEPQPDQAKVGDALTRTITIKASDVPGMLLPKLNHRKIDGMEVYPKQPQVKDKSERGELMGERIESMTYMCAKPGVYEIPELIIRWWNVEQKAWKEERFPSIELKVDPNPALTAKAGGTAEPESSNPEGVNGLTPAVLVGFALAVVITLALWLSKTVSVWRKQWSLGEAGLFARLVKVCREGDSSAADRAVTYWLNALGLPRSRLNTVVSVDDILAAELNRLQEALIDSRITLERSQACGTSPNFKEKPTQ